MDITQLSAVAILAFYGNTIVRPVEVNDSTPLYTESAVHSNARYDLARLRAELIMLSSYSRFTR